MRGALAGPRPLPADPAALGSRIAGTPLVVLLDVDGTLAPIAPRPEDAAVPAATTSALRALAARPAVHVGLVSGRGAADARRLVGVEGLWAVGNHGLETLAPDGSLRLDERVAPFESALAAVSVRARALTARVPGALLEDKGATLSIHYRLAEPREAASLQTAIEALAAEAGLRVTHGRKVVEVRPPVAVDKGTAVRALAERLGAAEDGASIVFAGDDTTDEDAMRALREWRSRAVTIHVEGEEPRETIAEWVVSSPEMLAKWLAALAAMPEGGGE
ncbi:MAG TPA: trehalose-phosphatase [Gemmatimonadaceae bacterium]|nr:trehalose-phosphatase [Gemmatimonadaceae bacterium]